MLSLQLSMTIDARRIIASLIDGCGIYLVANAVGNAVGIRSPTSGQRLTNITESTGFLRTVFPLSSNINSASIIAAAYLVGSIFLLRQPGGLKRAFRIAGAVAAILVIIGAGSRNALAVTVVISFVALLLPFAARWIGQASTILSAIAAFTLPSVASSFEFLITPLVSLNPGRETSEYGVVSFQGRAQIWDESIKFWNERINDLPDMLLGFGEAGQYRSGASLTYISIVRGLSRTPERTHVHNSFLQQMFDGGILGYLCLASALYWTAVRLSNRRGDWGHWAMSAIFALTAILLCSITESTSAPGIFEESSWVMIVLVSIACQVNGKDGISTVARPSFTGPS
jgi:O-antigen ligase